MKVIVAGASGYVGGELLRLLLQHPHVEVVGASSDTHATKRILSIHPHLRGLTDLRFCKTVELPEADFAFVALPHGKSFALTQQWAQSGTKIVNKSGDFRLANVQEYAHWYRALHPNPDLQKEFVYGLPELFGEKIAHAQLVAAPGCLATATILAAYPLVEAQLIDKKKIIAEGKIGSSAAGANPALSTHHALRSGVMRSYQAVGHRHTPEIEQALSISKPCQVMLSATAVEAVRGILVTLHGLLTQPVTEKEIWKAYRHAYAGKPFIRLIKDEQSLFGLPEPKLVMGTNYCDIGFALDENRSRVVGISALDNLMKGGAGQGVQCMNLMCGFPEETGLTFTGIHPS